MVPPKDLVRQNRRIILLRHNTSKSPPPFEPMAIAFDGKPAHSRAALVSREISLQVRAKRFLSLASRKGFSCQESEPVFTLPPFDLVILTTKDAGNFTPSFSSVCVTNLMSTGKGIVRSVTAKVCMVCLMIKQKLPPAQHAPVQILNHSPPFFWLGGSEFGGEFLFLGFAGEPG